ncbi:MAG TPA: DUF2567 domain-containing protein [Pilimelia sp.]|nr:DUF2567 domain-containing protein [Pilimelia sp.]
MSVPFYEPRPGAEPPPVINGAPYLGAPPVAHAADSPLDMPEPAKPGSPWASPDLTWPAPERPGADQVAEQAAEPDRRLGRTIALLFGVVLGVAALGAPLGWLWATLAPTVPVQMTEGGPVLADPQPEEFAAADGWFTLLGFGFGAAVAVVVWLVLRRHRGPAVLFAATLGALGAGLLAWWLGGRLGLAEYERLLAEAPIGARFGKPVDLRAADVEWLFGVIPFVRGDVLVPAFGAAVVYTLLAGWSRFPGLRPEPHQPYASPAGPYDAFGDSDPQGWGTTPVSWGSTATPTPPAEPAPPGPGEAAPPRD